MSSCCLVLVIMHAVCVCFGGQGWHWVLLLETLLLETLLWACNDPFNTCIPVQHAPQRRLKKLANCVLSP